MPELSVLLRAETAFFGVESRCHLQLTMIYPKILFDPLLLRWHS
jgi:hypothetical protein